MRLLALALLTAGPALAESHASGDPEEGLQLFQRQCTACHMIVDADGTKIAGRNARTGPNLYGVADRQIGSVAGYNYGDALLALNETGVIWTDDLLAAYMRDPTAWLRNALDDPRARSRMAFRVREDQQARDIAAFLATVTALAD